jgi:hypothetical protein
MSIDVGESKSTTIQIKDPSFTYVEIPNETGSSSEPLLLFSTVPFFNFWPNVEMKMDASRISSSLHLSANPKCIQELVLEDSAK